MPDLTRRTFLKLAVLSAAALALPEIQIAGGVVDLSRVSIDIIRSPEWNYGYSYLAKYNLGDKIFYVSEIRDDYSDELKEQFCKRAIESFRRALS